MAPPNQTTARVVSGGTALRPSGVRPAAPFASLPPVQAANRLLGMIPPVVQRRILPALGVVGTVAGTGGDVLRGRGPLGILGNNIGGWGGGALGAAGGAFVAGPIGGVLGGVGGGGLGGALLGTLGDALDGLFGNKPVRDNLPLFPPNPKGNTAGTPTRKDFDEPDIDYIDDFPNPGRGFGIRVKDVAGSTTPTPNEVFYGPWFTVKSYSIRNNKAINHRFVWGRGCDGVEQALFDLDFYENQDYSRSLEISSSRTCPGEPETITQSGTEPGRRRQGNGDTPTGPRSFPPAIPQTGPGQFPNFAPPTQPADRFGSPRGGEGNAPSSPQQVPGVNPIKPGSGDGSPAPAPPATNPAPPDARAPVANPQNRPKNPAPDNLDNPNGNPGRSPAATPAKKDAPGAGIQFDAMGLPVGRAGSGVYARANGGNVIEPKQSGFTNFGNGVRIPNEMLDSPEARKYYQDLAKALGTPGATLPDMPQKLRDKLNAPSSSTSTSTRPTAKPGETVTSDRPLVLPIPAPTKYTSTDRRPIQDRETSPFDAPDNANPSPAGSPCTGRCSAGISAGVRQANQKLDRLASGNGAAVGSGVAQGADLIALNQVLANQRQMLSWMGPTPPTLRGAAPGMGGFIQRFFDTVLNNQIVQTTVNWLTFFVVFNNAMMLGRNVVETVGDLMTLSLEAFRRQFGLKDREDEMIDVNEAVRKGFDLWMVSLLGKDQYQALLAKWIQFNRIYQAGAQILYNVRSLFDGSRAILELLATNVSRIGNALKNSRIVNGDAYPWMAENVSALTARWQRMYQAIENVENTASVLSGISGEVINIQDEAAELAESKQRFEEALDQGQRLVDPDGKPKPGDNKPIQALEDAKRRVSEAGDIPVQQFFRGGD
jgi:hypothetical protein